jgi:hypothetical protein
MEIPKELAPYFECCYILAFSICEACGCSAEFNSNYRQFSDEWWLDEAAAMKNQGWVVSEIQVAYCAICAKKLSVKHNPNAYEVNPNDF